MTLDFAGFGAGTCTVGITSLQDESLSEDAKRLQVAMMVAIGEAMDKLFGGLGKAKATAKKEDTMKALHEESFRPGPLARKRLADRLWAFLYGDESEADGVLG